MSNPHSFFQKISLETTVKGVSRFTDAATAAAIPADALVNIAYIGTDTLDQRLHAIDQLMNAGLTPRPIVSARRLHSAAEADSFIRETVVQRGLQRLFLVGGDPAEPVGPFEGALALLQAGHFDNLPLQAVCLPGHPEDHPVIPQHQLMPHLLGKIRALTERGFVYDITTQICLNPTAVADWICRVREQDVHAPIRVGVPTPTTVEAMLRFYRLCRVAASTEALAQHGWINSSNPEQIDPNRFIQVLLDNLAAANALDNVHLHIFPMSSLPESLAWFHAQANCS